MYAVIKQGGHQYKVAPGDIIQLEKIEGAAGELTFEEVLAVHDGENLHLGQPRIAEARVTVKVVREAKGKKVVIYKFKRRKGFAKKQGHRQPFTEVRVLSINLNGRDLTA